jgi:hypothetical protein
MPEQLNLPSELVNMHPDETHLAQVINVLQNHTLILQGAYKRLARLARVRGRRVIKYDVWAFVICNEALESAPVDAAKLASEIERLADHSVIQSIRNVSSRKEPAHAHHRD